MTGITREKASQVAASYLGEESLYLGTYYKTYAATDSQGRMWKFTYDGSIQAEKKENGERVPADKPYKTEMVSPICTYEDIPTIQELVRQLRHKGAFSNSSTGIHIHVDASSFDARTLRNLVNLFYSKEDLLFAALKVDPAGGPIAAPRTSVSFKSSTANGPRLCGLSRKSGTAARTAAIPTITTPGTTL